MRHSLKRKWLALVLSLVAGGGLADDLPGAGIKPAPNQQAAKQLKEQAEAVKRAEKAAAEVKAQVEHERQKSDKVQADARDQAKALEAENKELKRKIAEAEKTRIAAEAKRKAEQEAANALLDDAARTLTRDQIIQDDCPDCPKMVVIPAGHFTMGSPDDETGRWLDEGPQHPVRVGRFLMGQTEVTVAQFRRFTQAKSYQTDAERNAHGDAGCYAWDARGNNGDWRTGLSWRNPGWNTKDNEPATCISWNDAQVYVAWLSPDISP